MTIDRQQQQQQRACFPAPAPAPSQPLDPPKHSCYQHLVVTDWTTLWQCFQPTVSNLLGGSHDPSLTFKPLKHTSTFFWRSGRLIQHAAPPTVISPNKTGKKIEYKKMDPLKGEYTSETLLKLQERLAENKCITVFRVPQSAPSTRPAKEIPPLAGTRDKEVKSPEGAILSDKSRKDAHEMENTYKSKLDSAIGDDSCQVSISPAIDIGIGPSADKCEPSQVAASPPSPSEVIPSPPDPECSTARSLQPRKSETGKSSVSCPHPLPHKVQDSIPQSNVTHSKESHSQSFSENGCQRSEKSHVRSFSENGHQRVVHAAVNQQLLNAMVRTSNKGEQLPRYSAKYNLRPTRSEPMRYSPISSSLLPESCVKKPRSPKRTKLTLFLPSLNLSAENGLIKIFSELARWHGCDVHVDRAMPGSQGNTKYSSIKVSYPKHEHPGFLNVRPESLNASPSQEVLLSLPATASLGSFSSE